MLIDGNPDIDPLENDVNISIFSSQESTTPALESRKYFTVVVHYCTEVDPIGTLRNEASAIEFVEVNGSKSLQHWVRVISVRSTKSKTGARPRHLKAPNALPYSSMARLQPISAAYFSG
jgi:hypothetical protein